MSIDQKIEKLQAEIDQLKEEKARNEKLEFNEINWKVVYEVFEEYYQYHVDGAVNPDDPMNLYNWVIGLMKPANQLGK